MKTNDLAVAGCFSGLALGARRIKRELLKIDGKSVEIILRTNPRARRFIVKVDPATGEVSVVSPSSRSFRRSSKPRSSSSRASTGVRSSAV